MSCFLARRAETNAFVDDLLAKYKAQAALQVGNPNVCIELRDYPSDELMERVVAELSQRRYRATPVEYTATDGRYGVIWLEPR